MSNKMPSENKIKNARRCGIRSPLKKKVLLMLQAGVVLGLSRSPSRQKYIIKNLPKALRNIDRHYLYRLVHEFKNNRLIEFMEDEQGNATIALTEKGQLRVLKFNLDQLEVKKPHSWDRHWRVVMFDVPEKKRVARNALRAKLKELGFCELQRSVWVHPFPCRDEIDFLVECLEMRLYVSYAEMTNVTNESALKLHFLLT